MEIASATIELTPSTAEVRKVTASAGGNIWRGSLTIPRQCDTPRACVIGFDLHADEFVTDNLAALVNAVPGKQPWYRFLSSPEQPKPYLASIHAAGRLTAGRVLIHNLVANRVSSQVELEQGHLQLSNLRAEVLGGQHAGQWLVDFTVNPPACRGTGTLEKIALVQVADVMHDSWITGRRASNTAPPRSAGPSQTCSPTLTPASRLKRAMPPCLTSRSPGKPARFESTGSLDNCFCAPGSSRSNQANCRLLAASTN